MDSLKNMTYWDAVGLINKVKNVVMNYSEWEIKVRDATNNEPWGASSTLMKEIAKGTYQYDSFNDIMNTIYSRLTECTDDKWRQCYKALQLLEYLIKNGSERVVSSCHENIYVIRACQKFIFVDSNGKDQGINVRARAKEIYDLLKNKDKINEERAKAKENKNKYKGVSSEKARYQGFGSSSGFGSGTTKTSFSSNFKEISKNEEEAHAAAARAKAAQKAVSSSSDTKKENQSSSVKEINLLDLDFDESSSSKTVPSKTNNDDEWADFQSFDNAASTNNDMANFTDFQSFQEAPKVTKMNDTSNANKGNDDLFSLFMSSPPPTSTTNTTTKSNTFNSTPVQQKQENNLFNSVPLQPMISNNTFSSNNTNTTPSTGKKDLFSDLVSFDTLTISDNTKKQTTSNNKTTSTANNNTNNNNFNNFNLDSLI